MMCFGALMAVVYFLLKAFIAPLVAAEWTDYPIAFSYWTIIIFSLMTWMIEPGYLS